MHKLSSPFLGILFKLTHDSSSDDTTILLLQLLQTLVSSPPGAKIFVDIQDISPLTEIASAHAIVLDILSYAWLNSMTAVQDTSSLAARVSTTLQSLVSSFRRTDAVTLLEFLGYFLRNADSKVSLINTSVTEDHRCF